MSRKTVAKFCTVRTRCGIWLWMRASCSIVGNCFVSQPAELSADWCRCSFVGCPVWSEKNVRPVSAIWRNMSADISLLHYVLSALIRGRGISFLPLSQSLRQSCHLSCRVLRNYCQPAVHERWLRWYNREEPMIAPVFNSWPTFSPYLYNRVWSELTCCNPLSHSRLACWRLSAHIQPSVNNPRRQTRPILRHELS